MAKQETASPAGSSMSNGMNGSEGSFSPINSQVDAGSIGSSSDDTDGYLRTIIEQNRAIMQQNNLMITLLLDTMERVKTLENEPAAPVVNKKRSFLLKFQNLQFPINSVEKVKKLEEILQNENNFQDAVNEFAKFGGSGTYDFIKRVLSSILNNDVALMYSWLGRQAKLPFYKLKLAEVVICAAEEGKVAKNKKETEIAMQKWLKRACDRKAVQK